MTLCVKKKLVFQWVKPRTVGADGFKLMYLHFFSLHIVILHSLIRFLSFLWKFLVGTLFTKTKLLLAMKSMINW